MAKSIRAQRARDIVGSAGDNPYVRRLMEDEELRDSVRNALDAAKHAYARLSRNGNVIDTAIDDKKVHKDLKSAAENLRDASNRLRGKEKKRRWGRLILIGLAGATLALVFSEGLRNTVLEKLFGDEEECEYTSTTTPPASTPAATDA